MAIDKYNHEGSTQEQFNKIREEFPDQNYHWDWSPPGNLILLWHRFEPIVWYMEFGLKQRESWYQGSEGWTSHKRTRHEYFLAGYHRSEGPICAQNWANIPPEVLFVWVGGEAITNFITNQDKADRFMEGMVRYKKFKDEWDEESVDWDPEDHIKWDEGLGDVDPDDDVPF